MNLLNINLIRKKSQQFYKIIPEFYQSAPCMIVRRVLVAIQFYGQNKIKYNERRQNVDSIAFFYVFDSLTVRLLHRATKFFAFRHQSLIAGLIILPINLRRFSRLCPVRLYCSPFLRLFLFPRLLPYQNSCRKFQDLFHMAYR